MDVVCITGMHRSGTSLVARIVNLLGVDLGPPSQMVGASAENPRGFWENAAIQELNDDLLRHLGGHWANPPAPGAGWERSSELDALRARAGEILSGVFGPQRGKVGWKDPRTSLLLPFWRTVTDISSTILVIRDPSEVARSLEERNGFDREHGAYLWLRYTTRAWLDDPDRLVVSHRHVRDDLEIQARRIAAHLEMPRPDDGRIAAMRSFYDPALHRQRVDGDRPVGGPYEALAKHVHRHMDDPQGDTTELLIDALSEGWPRVGPYGSAVEAHDRLMERIRELEDAYRQLRRRRSVRIALKLVAPFRRIRGYPDGD